jgi:N-acetylglutamate synthase-like GNAT family acetyltransferase
MSSFSYYDKYGNISAFIQGDKCFIKDIYVNETYRGSGKGREFINILYDWLNHKNIKTVELRATEDSKGFYTKLGFVCIRENLYRKHLT